MLLAKQEAAALSAIRHAKLTDGSAGISFNTRQGFPLLVERCRVWSLLVGILRG
jgi:hypothetical protein